MSIEEKRVITITLKGEAEPALQEIRRVELALKRLRVEDRSDRFLVAFRAGRSFERALQSVRDALKWEGDDHG